MAEKRKAILLRISPELWERLNRWAADDLRSVNAQIEYLLREAVRKRSGQPADDDAAQGVFEAAYPWVQQLLDGLRQAGLGDEAQRLEGAISFGATPAQMLANLRADLEELVEGPATLPAEVASRAQGLLQALEEAGYRRAWPGEGAAAESRGPGEVAEEKPNEPDSQA